MSSDGPTFSRKPESAPEEQNEGSVVIERSDDPDFNTTRSRTSGSTMPSMQGKKVGCSSSVFLLMLVGFGMLGLVAMRVVL